MILNLNQYPIKVLFPKNSSITLNANTSLLPFADQTILALSKLGAFLTLNQRRDPSIVAAGYWLRKKNLLTLQLEYSHLQLNAKGVAFHIAPGNVDTLFFYSMILSVLCGNQTILRISNKLTEGTYYFIHLLESFFIKYPEFSHISSLMRIVQYEHDVPSGAKLTKELSLLADVRVVWGGNKAVDEISSIPLKTNASNITFPDRYSVAVIQLTFEHQIDDAVNALISDVFPFNQQACSSPIIIYWLTTAQKLQDVFWQRLSSILNEKIDFIVEDFIEQLVYLQRLPILNNKPSTKNEAIDVIKSEGHLKSIFVENITLEMISDHKGNYVLLNNNIEGLNEISLYEHCQTITIFGLDDKAFVRWFNTAEQPAKRWVAGGKALDFSHHWDGVDLVASLTSETKV